MNNQAIKNALTWLFDNRIKLPGELAEKLNALGFEIKADVPYADVRKRYYEDVFVAVYDYLDSDKSITTFKNDIRQAMVNAFLPAAEAGWEDGGQELPLDDEAMEWLAAQQEAEFGYIAGLFQTLKELRKEEDVDKTATATARAEGYAGGLDAIYNGALLMAQKNQLLVWQYGDSEHCETCLSLNGQKHRASWYLSRNYIPGKPGADLACGGYRCQCVLLDRNGNEVTI